MPQGQSVRLAASTPEQEEEAPKGLDKTNTSQSIFRLTPDALQKTDSQVCKGQKSREVRKLLHGSSQEVMHGGGTRYSSRQCYAFSKCLSIYNL